MNNASAPVPEETPASGPQANVLLVDDRRANLVALEAILHDLGLNLVTAQSGEEALRRLGEEDFAVVLLDVQMHGLDGFETAKLIRSRDRSRHTPRSSFSPPTTWTRHSSSRRMPSVPWTCS